MVGLFKGRLFVLTLILILALFLRVVDVQNNPRGMYGDGLTLVYDAYSILKTGHDQKGNFLPLVFELGGSRPPGYVYATVPFTALFGPTNFAARSVSILSGLGLVFLMYQFGKILISPRLGLIAAGFMAISPWDLALSRGPFETHLALFLSCLGIFGLIKSAKSKRWLITSGICFALAMQTYPTYRLTLSIFLVTLMLLYKKNAVYLFTKYRISLIIATSFIILSLLFSTVNIFTSSSDRFGSINIFNNPSVRASVSQEVHLSTEFDTLPFPLNRIFHNQILQYGITLVTNYTSNFFFSYLFIHGDTHPLSNPAEMGEFYWVDIVFIFFGMFYLYKNQKKIRKIPKLFLVLLIWIFITPIATSLVGEPHALRDSFMLVPIILISSFGLFNLLNNFKFSHRKLFFYILGGLFAINFFFFIDRFYFVAPNKFANFWSYPAKQASYIALQNQSRYRYIILSSRIDNMEFAYPVYAKLDPNLVIYQNQHFNSQQGLEGYHFLNYGNVYIGSVPNTRLNDFLNKLEGSALYVGSIEDQKFVSGYSIDLNADRLPDLIIHVSDKASMNGVNLL